MSAPAAEILPLRTVAALYVEPRGPYSKIEGIDLWDEKRDARLYAGPHPVVAHPPCAQWGILRGLARDDPEEKRLALVALDQVRRWGGVLEHPQISDLWLHCRGPDDPGWLWTVSQKWFGHMAEKCTTIYVVGLAPSQLPPYPIDLAEPRCVVTRSRRKERGLPEMPKSQRKMIPPAFAAWLVAIARAVQL